MKSYSLMQMKKGWFIGDFEPAVLKTDTFEVAVKEYRAGDREEAHYHKVATEITLIQSGKAIMFDREWNTGDIIIVEKGDVTSFEALIDTVTVVVKIPSVKGDKYFWKGEKSC